MRKSYVTVYDLNMRKIAMLENAANIGYETPLNTLWTATFELPINDPKNEYCQPFYFVEIFDGNERLELFRILPSATQRSAQLQKVKYQCEHVLATLLDDIMFQYHTIGNIGVYTTQVINYILSKQTTSHWQLGSVEFTHQFEYNWENSNLLGALFSVPKPFIDNYMWTWDTTSYPWTINLIRPSDDVQAYIRYGVNMAGITKEEDPTNLVNRIYALGYGEGVNQLTFADINGGVPYLEDATSQAKYGIKSTAWVDRRFEFAETLLARAQVLLNELKEPRRSYTVQAAELYNLTRDPVDKFRTGTIVRVQDKEIGIDFTARVVNVKKKNVVGAQGNVEIEIANKPQDIAGTIADLQNRMKISEVYAQGATNIDSYTFADNCDPDNPAVIKFFIPEDTVRINKMILSFSTEAFRAYSRAIQGGGGIATSTASGGGSNQTSSSGGGTSRSTESGGGTATSTASGGGTSTSTESGGQQVNTNTGSNYWNLSGSPSIPEIMTLAGDPAHRHQIYPHYHLFDVSGHTHDVTIPNHTHGMTIPNHTHDFTVPNHEHSVTIPSHEHSITLPNHVHEIEHGIFRSPITPTAVTIRVDGNVIPGNALNGDSIDIIPYLSKDGGGRITRGAWHEISATPNNLARIVMDISSQLFINSRGGGNF